MRYDESVRFEPVDAREVQPEPVPRPAPAGPVLTAVRRVLIALAIPVAWVLLVIMLWYASAGPGPTPRIGSVIRAHYPNVLHVLKVALSVCWFAALSLVLIEEARWRWAGLPKRRGLARGTSRAAICSAVTLLLLPMPLMFVGVEALWPMWQDRGSLRLAGGAVYHLQSYQVLQGRMVAITQELDRGSLFLRTRVLALASGESDTPIVRPRGVAEYDLVPAMRGGPWQQLVSSRDGRWLVAVRVVSHADQQGDACGAIIACDLKKKQPYGLGDLRKLSPFILVGPGDDLNEADAAALLHASGPPTVAYYGALAAETLARESSNPNPHVRELAKTVLGLIAAP